MKTVRKIIEIDETLCDGCGQCVTACAEGALEIVNGKAKVIADSFCDGLGACIGECPRGALKIVEREAEPFDEEAIKKHVHERLNQPPVLPCGCPSTKVMQFQVVKNADSVKNEDYDELPSLLTHWPVQIRLIPTNAPFLKDASLLIAADCVPVAYRNFHSDFLKGRTVMLGCPKFDDIEEYTNKFTDIFANNEIKDITVVSMEVPCCHKLSQVVKRALQMSNKNIPFKEVIISAKGSVLRKV
ncbi:MAG: 4Fe-4S binding protein [Thermodesulfovibrionales bacterium]|nr:4Fe-4S binding protein [Thermodesulfovibrionales bacterium]